MFYLHGLFDVIMDPFANEFVKQFSDSYRVVIPELDVNIDKSISILSELIKEEHPQIIVAKGIDAYIAMLSDFEDDVDIIVVNPSLDERLDKIPLWKFGNVFALCSARDESDGKSSISVIKDKYPDIHLMESKAFGDRLNKTGFKQLCRLVRTVAKYRELFGKCMTFAEYEDMVRNRPRPLTPGYYSLKIWSYDKSWQWKDVFSRVVVDGMPSYRRRISCRQVEFKTKEEAIKTMHTIAATDKSEICAFVIERLPFSMIGSTPLWLEAWSFDPNGNLIQEASCSAAHAYKSGIYGKFLGHLPEKVKWHNGDIVQVFHHYHGDQNTYATLGVIDEVSESTEEVYNEYLFATRQVIRDGKQPAKWLESTVFNCINDDEMFIQFGPYRSDWQTFEFFNPMRVLPAPENLPEDVISELQTWYNERFLNENNN